MSTNPNYEIKKQIDDEVMLKFETSSILKYFPSQKIGDGKQIWQRKFAEPPRSPLAQIEIERLMPQALKTSDGKYRLPRLNLSVFLTEDEYAERAAAGELPGHFASIANKMEIAVKRVCFQGKAFATGEVQCKAMVDGAGTSNDDPIVCANGTKKGLWSTTGFAIGDFGILIGNLDTHKEFDGPRLLLVPAVAMTEFNTLVPGLTTGETIKQKAQQMFTAIETAEKDDPPAAGAAAKCLLTGEVETAADFELFCVNPLCWTWVYDVPPFTNLIHDQINKRWIYEMEVHGALISTVLAEEAGVIYKALVKIDDCNNT